MLLKAVDGGRPKHGNLCRELMFLYELYQWARDGAKANVGFIRPSRNQKDIDPVYGQALR